MMAGVMPLARMAGAASGEIRNLTSSRAASGELEVAMTQPEKTVIGVGDFQDNGKNQAVRS